MEILDFCVDRLNQKGLSSGSNKFELFFEKSKSLSIEIQDKKVDSLTEAVDKGLSIRILKDGRMGFSYTFDLTNDAIDLAIQQAVEIAELMPKDELNTLQNFTYSYDSLKTFDEQGLNIPIEKKIEMAKELEANVYAVSPKIKNTRNAGFDQTQAEVILVDSKGKNLHFKTTVFNTYVYCVAEENGSSEMGADAQSVHFFNDLDHKKVSLNSANTALEMLGSVKAPTGSFPVIFKNSIVAQVLGFLSASFSSENVDKNFSLLAGKLNKEIFSKAIHLEDNGLIAAGIASAPFDAEGTPTQKNILIENGILKNYLYDIYYAKKMKTKSTGSARRGSLKTLPGIGPSNMILASGKKSKEDLIRSISKGMYITNVMGLHTANPITGDFSLGASGIWIENGELSKPMKGFAIAGNILSLLKNVTEVGANTRWFGSIQTPSIMVSELSIGGT